jgi:RNA polymerase sigma-70 factor (ECF subfamily)
MGRPIDRRAVDQLVVEHLPAALRLAARLAGDAHAEDLVQEALCRVLRQWKSFRGESSFTTWLLQIVVNVDRDRRRRARPDALDDSDVASPAAGPPEQAAATELQLKLRAAVDLLPARQREVAHLMWGEGLSAAETASVLGIAEANVYVNLHHARSKVAASLGVDRAVRE